MNILNWAFKVFTSNVRKMFRKILSYPRSFSTTGISFQNLLNVRVENEKFVVLEKNQEKLKFPGIWLRDNCQCSSCFDKKSQSRKIDWENFPKDVSIDSIEVSRNVF